MDLEAKSIERIKLASEMSKRYYDAPIICTYSGGKDSDVLLDLFIRSNVEFEVHNSHTTVDAPDTVYYIREKFRGLKEKGIPCYIHMPSLSMWQLIVKKKMPPTRMQRYCCEILKENTTPDRMVATGVRWDESVKRSKRGQLEAAAAKVENQITLMNDNDDKRLVIERCAVRGRVVSNPIIDWEHRDIWDYIRSNHMSYNPLYNMGYKRVGCVGCPMAGKNRYKEFADFPKYKAAYIRAFEKMLVAIHAAGKETKWKNGEDVFRWWMQDQNIEGQLCLADFMDMGPDNNI